MCKMLHDTVEHLVVVVECEPDLIEMKMRMSRCTLWKARPGVVNGMVEPMCPITFLSELTELKSDLECVAEIARNSCRFESAEAENMRAVKRLSSPPAQIVKYSFNITLSVSRSRVAFHVRLRDWTGLPF